MTELGLWSSSTPLLLEFVCILGKRSGGFRLVMAGFGFRILINLVKRKDNKKWLAGGMAFLFILISPPPAFCQKASIKDINVKRTNGVWKVSFNVENCFTEKMEEAIQSGIRTTFTFYINLYQKRSWWKDRKMASHEFHHTVQYHPIQKVYQVTLEENHSPLVASGLVEAKKLMSRVKEFEIRPSSPSEPEIPAYFRIKAELDPVRLPLHLEYLFFFVSLWDFETDWYVKPLPP